MLSLVIPTLNEEKNIDNIKNIAKYFHKFQIIIVDGGSSDSTIKKLKKCKFDIFFSSPNRGKQMRIGAEKSKGKWLLFLHADCILNMNNVIDIENFLKNKDKNYVGYFKLKFNSKSIYAVLISFWANLRTKIFRLPFGDQGLIIGKKEYFSLGSHKEIKLMEDLDFITRVRFKRKVLLNSYIITSFEKYKKNGIFRQGGKHLLCQILFFLGIDNETIFKIYKK
tara:strand:- start:847 stop:1515 length:669 start_codon:yes stop_codon:yes gene_type:complete